MCTKYCCKSLNKQPSGVQERINPFYINSYGENSFGLRTTFRNELSSWTEVWLYKIAHSSRIKAVKYILPLLFDSHSLNKAWIKAKSLALYGNNSLHTVAFLSFFMRIFRTWIWATSPLKCIRWSIFIMAVNGMVAVTSLAPQ